MTFSFISTNKISYNDDMTIINILVVSYVFIALVEIQLIDFYLSEKLWPFQNQFLLKILFNCCVNLCISNKKHLAVLSVGLGTLTAACN